MVDMARHVMHVNYALCSALACSGICAGLTWPGNLVAAAGCMEYALRRASSGVLQRVCAVLAWPDAWRNGRLCAGQIGV